MSQFSCIDAFFPYCYYIMASTESGGSNTQLNFCNHAIDDEKNESELLFLLQVPNVMKYIYDFSRACDNNSQPHI